MKKIIYSALAIIISLVLSSYMYSSGSTGSVKKQFKNNDSTQTAVNINVTAKNVGPYKLETSDVLNRTLESTLEVNTLKIAVLKKLEKEELTEKKVISTNQEVVLEKYGYNKEFIVKRIRNDMLIKFISILITLIPIFLLIKLMKKYKEDWPRLLVKGFFIIILLLASQMYLYYILSYLFNGEFLIMKKLISMLI
jgi:hypothetical protein